MNPIMLFLKVAAIYTLSMFHILCGIIKLSNNEFSEWCLLISFIFYKSSKSSYNYAIFLKLIVAEFKFSLNWF